MATAVSIQIYSNDGSQLYGTYSMAYNETFTVTNSGCDFPSVDYTYAGTKKFLGLATSANATTPTYAVGSTFSTYGSYTDYSLYVVEGTATTVTDLRDTTWEVRSGWAATAGYGQFSVHYEVDDYLEGYELDIGYEFLGFDPPYISAKSNTITFMSSGYEYVSTKAFIITFIDGTDLTNPDLILWLETHGTLQGGETSTPKLYIGNKAVTSMSIGNKAILKMYVGNELIYEKSGGEESVSITLVAESGGASEQATVYIKFGTPPTDGNDYDYFCMDGERNLLDRNMSSVGNNIQIDVSTKAYIWQVAGGGELDTKAGYKLNNGSLVNVGVIYSYPTEITLTNGDTLSLVSTGLD